MEELKISATDKRKIYEEIIPQISEILADEPFIIARMANLCAILKEAFDFWWVGFYLVDSVVDINNSAYVNNKVSRQLVLGPFQGPIACQRINFGRGVCGTAWREARTIVVADVEQFPGHIACSSLSRSEIVVPIFDTDSNDRLISKSEFDCVNPVYGQRQKNGQISEILGVLDIDSKELNAFDNIDKEYLEKIVGLL